MNQRYVAYLLEGIDQVAVKPRRIVHKLLVRRKRTLCHQIDFDCVTCSSWAAYFDIPARQCYYRAQKIVGGEPFLCLEMNRATAQRIKRDMEPSIKDVVNEAVDEAVAENAARPAQDAHALHTPPSSTRYLLILAVTALGVVYGDIGTSPLYALRECFYGLHAVALTPANIFGVLSLIFWALIMVVTVKYLIFVLRADNRGEGGILALTALATPIRLLSRGERRWLVILGVFGAALLYGDGAITPAISVLSAVEGLNVATPFFAPYVIPITMVILVGIFLIQSQGTALVGRLFGPITLLWFTVLGLLGLIHLVSNPAILGAINPAYGFAFFRDNGWAGYLVLGSVFLVVTGAEALYADMGHFGKRPIRLAWFTVVLPALLLNYFGQGALLLANPEAVENPFYRMAPSWALYPLVVLATLATVIASQALISGSFSITMQAVQLGFLPRMNILHTSRTEYGQIYIPAVNWLLMVTCLIIVLGFRTSSNLAAAYGMAVTSTMAITTVIFYVVIVERWQWNRLLAALLAGFFLIIDLAFLGANIIKIPQGGWFSLVLALFIFAIMMTWKKGRYLVAQRVGEQAQPIEKMLQDFQANPPVRVPGTAIFLSNVPKSAPTALLANLEHNHVLHEQLLLLTVNTALQPHVPDDECIEIEPLGQGIYQITLTYGFMEEPNVPKAVAGLPARGIDFDPKHVSYFVNHTTVIASRLPGMALWREKLFALMSHNAASAADFFCLPADQVFVIGRRVEF